MIHDDKANERLRQRHAAMELAKQFEEMLRNNQVGFMEQDTYVYIVDYYEDNFELEKAMAVLDYAIEQHPYTVQFLVKKAQIVAEYGHYNDALNLLENASLLDPSELEVFLLKAHICASQRDFVTARRVLKKALSIADREEKVEVYLALAEVYEHWGKERKVYDQIREALLLMPTHEEALTRLDYQVAICENYEDSIDLHEWILDQEPYCGLAWYNLGKAYHGMGLFEKAVEAFGFAVVINERFEMAYLECGNAHYELGDFAMALEQYTQALEHGEADEDVHTMRGKCFWQMKKYEAAISCLKQALQVNEKYQEALYTMGCCFEEQGLLKEALVYFHQSILPEPLYYEWVFHLANIYETEGAYIDAILVYRQVAEKDPYEGYLVEMVRLYLEVGHEELALSQMELLMTEEMQPSANYRCLYAVCLIVNGLLKEGILQLEMSLAEDANCWAVFKAYLPATFAESYLLDELFKYYK